jgi:hypothetical protein
MYSSDFFGDSMDETEIRTPSILVELDEFELSMLMNGLIAYRDLLAYSEERASNFRVLRLYNKVHKARRDSRNGTQPQVGMRDQTLEDHSAQRPL